MGQDFTGLFRLRARGVELDPLLQFQRRYGLRYVTSNTRWSVQGEPIRLESAPPADSLGFATDLAGMHASRHAEFEGDGLTLGLGVLDRAAARFVLLTITERALADFIDALSRQGEDMLSYLAALAALLDADALVLGRNLDVATLLGFLHGAQGAPADGRGVCVASGVPAASERTMRAHARVLEKTLQGRRLLHSWLPGHDHYFR
jgi:hypothetical protein